MLIQLDKKVKEISNDRLIKIAPSIGATSPYHEVSEKYSFVPTVQAVNFLRDSGWLPVMATEINARRFDKKGYQKHMIRLTRPDLVVNGHRMDLVLYNSHDRGCAFHIVGGVFRFVCENGMIIGDRMAEFSHKHIGFAPEKFIDSSLEVGQHLEGVAGVLEGWQAIDLTPDEMGVFAIAAHQAIYENPDEAPVKAKQLLTTRRFDDRGKSDLWTTFNTVQENSIKGGLRGINKKGQRVRTRGVKSIDRDRKLNQALWVLTEKMAELKAN